MKYKANIINSVILMGVCNLLIANSAFAQTAGPISANCLHSYVGDPMPKQLISGIPFPTADVTLDVWVKNQNYEKMNQHSWDIWAALTERVNDSDWGVVSRFETWKTPDQIANNCQQEQAVTLKKPNQFHHANIVNNKKYPPKTGQINDSIIEAVRYSPAATHHAAKYDLFNLVSLQKIYNAQKGQGVFPIQIPDFPAQAVTIKPVYKVFTQNTVNENYAGMTSWPGLPKTARAFPETDWNTCVYIDFTNNTSNNDPQLDKGCDAKNPSKNSNIVYNIKDFIHIEITEQNIDDFIHLENSLSLGDYVVLVAMHVTTREITRWTWQTYFWSHNPDQPSLPSTVEKANARPAMMPLASDHYAMANGYATVKYGTKQSEAGYAMVWPAQPDLGGKSVGAGVVVFNPYLEAGFTPATFNPKNPILGKNGSSYTAKFGIQSNCMSCHAMAALPGEQNPPTHPNYVADFYYSLDNKKFFEGNLKMDFAWSITSTAK
ncbi:MAG: hypothetical protein JKY19_10110 [Alcanivoracaceae bacterium]|nr:hypothetical protein [Alcanivoracaceae bacterium]